MSIDQRRARVQRRTLTVVVISQVLGGAGLAAGVTVGALLAGELLGHDGVAGLPVALFTLGAALTAYLVGRLTGRFGRRVGLGIGFAAGGLGGFGVVAAAVAGNIPLLFAAFFVYGAGTATNLQARYAGGDLALPDARGRAISIAMVSTTLGAVAGPNLVEPMGSVAVGLGIPALAGPFLLSGAAYLAAGIVLLALLRPDPLLFARQLEEERSEETLAAAPAAEASRAGLARAPTGADPATGAAAPSHPARHDGAADGAAAVVVPETRPRTGAYVGAAIMVLIQIAMVAIMTMTPVHMRAHNHSLSDVGLVIGLHIAAMYLPSLATGALVDRIGRTPVAVAAGVTLLAAGLVGAFAPGDSLGLLVLSLVLLGVGWNLGLISGTALVVDATVPENRPRVQGSIDVLVSLAGAGGGAASGFVMVSSSYAGLSVAGGVLAMLFIPVLWWARRRVAST
ncbi:MFS transporter [Zhihengliuella salsuginis]|uniref:Tetracycline resistance protein n=1 Tax=Zhihengliuella salsuginis TaxID=578222 RepID=A0ABQ3GM48_9MICC|nr:MFS transporter [Zhihengliuella salsuginis]GHD11036.1 tetracycline resistance protein [Zhihengliuella salsuginis]